jgi:putative ATPase
MGKGKAKKTGKLNESAGSIGAGNPDPGLKDGVGWRPRLVLGEPLANLLRPKTLEEFFGQEELVGRGRTLKKLIESDQLHSMIFFGPPGVGKTTLAQIIAERTAAKFVTVSAVTAGVPELRKIVEEADEYRRMGTPTILFVDEIHRFNKSQQDFLLPHTERGTVVLIGATTENPSFEVNSALLSRAQVFVFKALDDQALEGIINQALRKLADKLRQEGQEPEALAMTEEAREFLIGFANGDARNLLNTLEVILKVAEKWPVDLEEMREILQKKNLRYDKKGEEHYNIISALHKSLRDSDPDGALYWMMRMIEGGEDPLYIARRLIRFASEDIGMADPHALLVAVAAKDAAHFNGLPECEVNLAQAVVHLAMAPKSNALYTAVGEIKGLIRETGNLEVPLHIRNAPTKLMKEWGYGKGYKYAHNFENAKVDQEHLPDQLKGHKFYHPTNRGVEAKIKEKLDNQAKS